MGARRNRAEGAGLGTNEIEGERFAAKEFLLEPLPFGYHTLEISAGDVTYRSLILSAPMRSFSEPDSEEKLGRVFADVCGALAGKLGRGKFFGLGAFVALDRIAGRRRGGHVAVAGGISGLSGLRAEPLLAGQPVVLE